MAVPRHRARLLIRRPRWALAALLLLAACGGTVDTPGEPLRLLNEPLTNAFVGEPYEASLRAVGGLRPFTFTLSDGALPPGLELTGGALVGTPTEIGRFPFTVTVTDAALNKTFAEYTLAVIEIPPPTLTFNVPQTQVQRQVTLRVELEGRAVRGFRTRATWDPELFAFVEGSLTHGPEAAVLTQVDEGSLQADVVALGPAWSGSRRAFSFALEPLVEAPTLRLVTTTEFLARDKTFFARDVEGAPLPEPEGDVTGEDPQDEPTGTDEETP